MRLWTYNERAEYRLERQRWPEPRIPQDYIGCLAPFDPEHSAIFLLLKQRDALSLCIDGLLDEYAISVACGRGTAWKGAMQATAEFFATPLLGISP